MNAAMTPAELDGLIGEASAAERRWDALLEHAEQLVERAAGAITGKALAPTGYQRTDAVRLLADGVVDVALAEPMVDVSAVDGARPSENSGR